MIELKIKDPTKIANACKIDHCSWLLGAGVAEGGESVVDLIVLR
uniref:Uncharacterized protein n=1 Tax=Rhizophora mucronata TaxID=61149 RepID=A0A2P2Q9A4_RHIMU